jgi:hypothetical protein
VLDATDERVVARVVLVYHRRAARRGVLDDHLHRVAPEGRLGPGRLHLLRLPQHRRVLERVVLHLGEVRLHLRQPGVLGLELPDQARHRHARHLAVEAAHPAQRLAAPHRHLVQKIGELLLQRRDQRLVALLLGGRQPAELLRPHHAFLAERAEGEAARRAHQQDLHLLGALAHLVHRAVVALGELGLDLLVAVAVLVALERRRDRGAQVFHQARHVGLEGARSPRGQAQRARPVGRFEVVDVAPVRGRGQAGGLRFQPAAHQRVPAEALRAHGEQVVALAPHADAELDCFERAALAECFASRLELGGGGKGQALRVAAPAQALQRQGFHRPQCAGPDTWAVDLGQIAVAPRS